MDQNNPEMKSRKVPGSRDLGPKIGQSDARQTRGIVQDAARGSRGGRPVRAAEPRSPRGRTAKPNKSKSCQKVGHVKVGVFQKTGGRPNSRQVLSVKRVTGDRPRQTGDDAGQNAGV